MHYLIAGLAKSGTTILFSQARSALTPAPAVFFEPDTDEALAEILAHRGTTLTKVLIGRVTAQSTRLAAFDRHLLIYRDPRDQFLSMLLYLFYDFQVSGDRAGYRTARAALERKVADPQAVSTMALYNTLAGLVGRAPVAVFSRLHAAQAAYEQAFAPVALRYEDLVDGRVPAGVEAYLGFSLDRVARVPEAYARVARSRGYGEWRRWFNAEDLAFANQEWGAALTRLGYPPETVVGELAIDPAHSLDYVAQFEPGTDRA